jgi:hypothetical protein
VSFRALWAFLAVALPVLASLLAPMSTVDLTYHLRAGSEILSSGAIPASDTWTFTAAGLSWFDQQWGAQVILRVFELVGGWTGLAVLRAALTGVIFATLFAVGWRRGLDPRPTALLTLAAFVVAAPAMALRPQLVGMALFAVLLLIVDSRRMHPRLLWLAPVIVLVWANVHGSFFLGPLTLGLAWLADLHDRSAVVRTTLAVTIASAVAACVTPFGPAVWLYAVSLSSDPAVTARVSEWQPTSLRTIPGILFFASAGAVVAFLARRARPTPWPTLLWLAVFFVIGAYAERGVAWWPLAATTAVFGLLEPSIATTRVESRTTRRLNVAVAGIVVIAGVALLPIWRPFDARLGAPAGVLTDAPPGVTEALRSAVTAGERVLNPQRWGSWFEYVAPTSLVAVDSRVELVPAAAWATTERIRSGAPGWQGDLDTMGVDLAVASPSEAAFRDRLVDAGWVTLYDGADGSILKRPTG